VRRSGDKQFKMARLLRKELAKQQEEPQPPLLTMPPTPMATPAPVKSESRMPKPPPAAPRNTDPEPGWNLPGRRKFRYRLEDVAY
jgi:hypothetical protein